MHPYRAIVLIVSAGLVTFGLVYTLLAVQRSNAAAPRTAVVVAATPTPTDARAPDSLALKLAPDQLAVGVPTGGSEPLLRGLQPGDRLDVLASLASSDDGRPITSVVVRGASVLRDPANSDVLFLSVRAPDAVALAHLVLGGTKLTFAVWPANATPPEPRPLDERTARALLGLAALATPTPVPAPPSQLAVPALVPATAGGFIYQVQEGDTWESVADIFSVSAADLRRWNAVTTDPNVLPSPGSLLVIPQKSWRNP